MLASESRPNRILDDHTSAPVVVLHERLHEHPCRERVADAEPSEVHHERAHRKGDVVAVPGHLGVEPLTDPHRQLRPHLHPVTTKEPSEDGADTDTDRGTPVRVSGELSLDVIIRPDRYDDARKDLKRLQHPFLRQVYPGVHLVPVAPFPMVVHMGVLGLLLAGVKVPDGVVVHMRAYLV